MRQAPLVLAGGLPAMLLAACSKPETAVPPPAQPTDFITAAVADTTRLAEARVRDALRKPAEVMAFSGIQPGDTVVEIQPAGGYDTALLSRVAGPTGRVIAIDSERVFEYMPRLREEFTNFIAKDLHRSNADTHRAEVEAAGFVLQSTSNVLANPDDPHTDSIFEVARRGHTDQFVFRFVKPTPVPIESAAG